MPSQTQGWTCTVCECMMAVGSKDAHLAGRRHKKNVDRSNPIRTESVTRQINSSPLSDEQWFCDVCDIWIAESSKSAHLKSEQHYEEATYKPWKCDICKLAMANGEKAHHLLAIHHIKAQKRNVESVEQDASQSEDRYAPDAHSTRGSELAGEKKGQHIKAQKHDMESVNALQSGHRSAPNAPVMHVQVLKDIVRVSDAGEIKDLPINWKCEVCKVSMRLEDKNRHLVGIQHRYTLQNRTATARTTSSVGFYRNIDPLRFESLGNDTGTTNRVPHHYSTVSLIEVPFVAHHKHTPQEASPEVKVYNKGLGLSINELANQRARWYCSVCRTPMASRDTNQHLSGKEHHDNKMKHSQNRITKSTASSSIDSIAKHAADLHTHDGDKLDAINSKWRCIICNASMAVRDKIHHLSGKRHREKEGLQVLESRGVPATISDACTVEIGVDDLDTNLYWPTDRTDNETNEVNIYYTQVVERDYQSSEADIDQVKVERNDSIASTVTTIGKTINNQEKPNEIPLWECLNCDIKVTMKDRRSHLLTYSHIKNVPPVNYPKTKRPAGRNRGKARTNTTTNHRSQVNESFYKEDCFWVYFDSPVNSRYYDDYGSILY
ncbi:hypothetical protein BDQ17DRAFT_1412013 [Cyathus striatus]|nr:hypothetical protein BDQ17DRAFT_1412013 [Cyathus striatus]